MARKRRRHNAQPRWAPDEGALQRAQALCAAFNGEEEATAAAEGGDGLRAMLPGAYSLSVFTGNTAGRELLDAVLDLTKRNMERLYNETDFMGGWNDRIKFRELSYHKTHFLVLRDDASALVGFVSYRLLVFREFQPPTEVLYIYELQVDASCVSRGIGRFLMSAAEVVARHVSAKKLMCTVLKANVRAVRFYRDKCGFVDDESDPDVVDFDHRHEHTYHVLMKRVDQSSQ